jgi:hypothetical protein
MWSISYLSCAAERAGQPKSFRPHASERGGSGDAPRGLGDH